MAANTTRHVAIVGAGWSGLAAAVELAAAGCAVTVFESARTPGGRARSVEHDGETLDNGQHLLSGAYSETLGLMARVGVAVETALLRMPLKVVVPGRFSMKLPRLPAPLHLAVGMVAASGPTLMEKLRASDFMRLLQREKFVLDHDQAVSNWLDAHEQLGPLRRYLWEPLCLAALNTPADRASAQVFANVLRDTLGGGRSATDLLIPRLGLGQLLPQPALDFIAAHGGEVRMPARVRAIVPAGSGFRVGGDGFEVAADQVILACAPQHVSALLPQDPRLAPITAQLASFTYEPIGTVYVRYPPAARLPLPLLALPRAPGQWVFDHGALDARPGLIAHVLSASGAWQRLSDQDLADALHRELAASVPGLPDPIGHFSIQERRATFTCRPRLDRPENRTALPGFWLAGDYTRSDYPATIEAAVRSGKATAQAVLAS